MGATSLIIINNSRSLPHRNAPRGAGADVISFREASLVDGDSHVIKAVNVDERFSYVNISEAFRIG